MTREETASFIRAYLDGDTAVGNVIPIRDVLESAFTYLKEQPSLPSNLDEAANMYGLKSAHGEDNYCAWWHRDGFKAGAEWMAGQGVTFETEVYESYTGKPIIEEITDSFIPGDKVIVQIRKK